MQSYITNFLLFIIYSNKDCRHFFKDFPLKKVVLAINKLIELFIHLLILSAMDNKKEIQGIKHS